MKKYSILLGAALGMLALASCQKEIETIVPEINANKHIPFELKADVPETKTTYDADTWEMAWENNDVIYAVTTDGLWGLPYSQDNPGESIADFTYSGGSFTTDLEIEDGEHTFNFLYTANESQRSFHRSAATTFSLAASQAEDANSPTATLKLNDVLAGQITAKTPTTFVNVPMDHLFTLMKVSLKNKTGESITVNSFEIKVPNSELAGIFAVSFGDTPTVSIKEGQTGKDNINVSITNGIIANNDELPVYFVMAPLSNYSGEITFKVTDTDGNSYTKKNTVSGVTFEAGKYNTASYTLKAADPVEAVTLDWIYPEGDAAATSSGISSIEGVTVNGLGTDYNTSNSPYCIKFDNDNDYIQVRTDKAIGSVSVKYKMIGGANKSTLEVFESTNGTSWNKVEDLTISGAQNSTGELVSSEEFDAASRFVKINFKKGSNIGIGGISIKQLNTDPVIFVDNISGVAATGATGTLNYTVRNFEDDVTVSDFTGCVSQASASNGTISYTISPNYGSSAASGTIVLVSNSNAEITKTVNVGQLKSTLSVNATEVTIPASASTATFNVTTAEFGYSAIVASIESEKNLSITGGASGDASVSSQTITVYSTTPAPTDGDPITLGTIRIYRNGNLDDPQLVTIVVKKAVAGATVYTLTFPDDNSEANGVSAYDKTWTATIGATSWTITNFNNNSWNNSWKYIKCGRKNTASVGTIVTSLDAPIKTVKVTVDASTSDKVNSFKLFVATDADFTENVQIIAATIGVGENVFAIPTPTEKCYYKLEIDCASGSSNGLVTISKVVYSTN